MFPIQLLKKDNQGYNILTSVRLDGISSVLYYTPKNGGVNYKQTQSTWIKLSRYGSHTGILLSSWRNIAPKQYYWKWEILNSKLVIYYNNGSTATTNGILLQSRDRIFTDLSNWYHITAALDTTQQDHTNRLKIYVNGNLITDWEVDQRATKIIRFAENIPFATPNVINCIGKGYLDSGGDSFFEGNFFDYHFIDGESLGPEHFTRYYQVGKKSFLIPKVNQFNHGVNGFHLKFDFLANAPKIAIGFDNKLDPMPTVYQDERNFIQGTDIVDSQGDFFGNTKLSSAIAKFGNTSLHIPNNTGIKIKPNGNLAASCMTLPISGVFESGNLRFDMTNDWTIEAWVYPVSPPPGTGKSNANIFGANDNGKTMSTLLCFHESTGEELSKNITNGTQLSGTQWGVYAGLTEPGLVPDYSAEKWYDGTYKSKVGSLFNFNETGSSFLIRNTIAPYVNAGLNVFGLFHGYYPEYGHIPVSSGISPINIFKIPRGGNTTGFDAIFSNQLINTSGISLGWGLTGTRANMSTNGWLVSGFATSSTTNNRDVTVGAHSSGKYWQFAISITSSGSSANPLTGFVIDGISGLSVITNISTAQTTFGPRQWALLYSSGELDSPPFQKPIAPGGQNFHIVADYFHTTNTANQTINLSTQWNSAITNSGFILKPGQTGIFRIVGVGGANVITPTGFAIMLSGTAAQAPNNTNDTASVNGFGVFGKYRFADENTVRYTPSIETKYFGSNAEAAAYFKSINPSAYPNDNVCPKSPTGNFFLVGTSNGNLNSELTLNQWNHIAITHRNFDPNNTNFRRFDYYKNGVHVGRDSTYSSSKFFSPNRAFTGYANYLTIGAMPVWNSGKLDYVNPFYGYIDDLKINTGIYYNTGGFFVPTAPLGIDYNTILYAPFDGSNNGLRTTYYYSGAYKTNLEVSGFNSGDIFNDTPSFRTARGINRGNYATLNILDPGTNIKNAGLTLEGDTAQTGRATFGLNTGKWYWEASSLRGNINVVCGIVSDDNKSRASQVIYGGQSYGFRLNLDVFPPTLEYSQTADTFSAYWTRVPLITGANCKPGEYYYPFLQINGQKGSFAEINFGQKPFRLWENIYDRENVYGHSGYFNTTGYWKTVNSIQLSNLAINPTEHLQIKQFQSQDVQSAVGSTSIDFGSGDNPSLFMLVKGTGFTPEQSSPYFPAVYYEPIIVPNRALINSGNNIYLQINSDEPARDLGVPADLAYMGKRWFNLDTFNNRIVETKFLSGVKDTSDFGFSVAINNSGTKTVVGAPDISSSHLARPINNASIPLQDNKSSLGKVIVFTGIAGQIENKNLEITPIRFFSTGTYPFVYNFIFNSFNDYIWNDRQTRSGIWVGYGTDFTEGYYQTGYTGLRNDGILTGATSSNAFGYSVSINGDESAIVIGAPKTSYIKQIGYPDFFSSGTWIPTGFGKDYTSVSLSNDGKYVLLTERNGHLLSNSIPINSEFTGHFLDRRRNISNLRINYDGSNQYAIINQRLAKSYSTGLTWMTGTDVFDFVAVNTGGNIVYRLANDTSNVIEADRTAKDGIDNIQRLKTLSVSVDSGNTFQTIVGHTPTLYFGDLNVIPFYGENLKKIIISKSGNRGILLFKNNFLLGMHYYSSGNLSSDTRNTNLKTDQSWGAAFKVFGTGINSYTPFPYSLDFYNAEYYSGPKYNLRHLNYFSSAALSEMGQYQIIVNNDGLCLRSIDGGANWSPFKLNTGCVDVAMNNDGSIITVISQSGQIFRSTNYGNSFVTGGLVTNTKPYNKIKMNGDGRYQLISTRNNYLYTSNDFGANWTPRLTDINRTWNDIDVSSDGAIQIAVSSGINSQTNSNTQGEIFISTNYGINWSNIKTNVDINYSKVAQSKNGRYKTIVASNGKIFTSSNYGLTWKRIDLEYNFTSVDMTYLGDYQVACVYNGNLVESFDFGNTWKDKLVKNVSPKKWVDIAISKIDSSVQVLLADGDQIYLSVDKGINWTAKESSRNWKSVSISSNGQVQTALGYNTQIYRSNNKGNTWSASNSIRDWSSVSMSEDGRYQIAAESNGLLYESTNFGANWTSNSIPGSVPWASVSMNRDGRFRLASTTGIAGVWSINDGVWFSKDAGTSWNQISGTPADKINIERGWKDTSISADGRYIIGLDISGNVYNSKLVIETGFVDTMVNAGIVYLYTGSRLNYNLAGFITGDSVKHGQEHFGHKVKINQDGNLLAISAPYEKTEQYGYQRRGAVYLYTGTGSTANWKYCQKIISTEGSVPAAQSNKGDLFGWDIDVNVPSISSGKHSIIIGEPGYSYYPGGVDNPLIGTEEFRQGRASIVSYDDTIPEFYVKNHIYNPISYNSGAFGYSVASNASGNLFVIGAPSGDFDPNNVYTIVTGIYRIGSNRSYYNQNDSLIGSPFSSGSQLTSLYNRTFISYPFKRNDSNGTPILPSYFLSRTNVVGSGFFVGTGLLSLVRTTAPSVEVGSWSDVWGWAAGTFVHPVNGQYRRILSYSTGINIAYGLMNSGQYYQFSVGVKNNDERITGFRITGFEGLKFRSKQYSPNFWTLFYSGQFQDTDFKWVGSFLSDRNKVIDISSAFSNIVKNANIIIPATGVTDLNYTTGIFRLVASSPSNTNSSIFNPPETTSGSAGLVFLSDAQNTGFSIKGSLITKLTGQYSNFRMNAPFFVKTNTGDFFQDPQNISGVSSYYNNLGILDKRQTGLKNYIVQTNFPGRNVFISTTGWSGNYQINQQHRIKAGDRIAIEFPKSAVLYTHYPKGDALTSNTFIISGINSDYDLSFNCLGDKDFLQSGYCRLFVPNSNIDGTGRAWICFSPLDGSYATYITGLTGSYSFERRSNPNIYNDINLGFGSIRRPYTSLFGAAVGMSDSGHVVMVGAPKEFISTDAANTGKRYGNRPDAGSIYLYTGAYLGNDESKWFKSSGTFRLTSIVNASNRASYNNYGSSIAINRAGDFIAIGSQNQNNPSGVIDNNISRLNKGDENILNYSGAAYIYNLGRPKIKDFFNPPRGNTQFSAYNFGSNDNKLDGPFVDTRGKIQILTYEGNANESISVQEVPHRLNARPAFVLTKCISNKSDWWVWHHEMNQNYSYINFNKNFPVISSGAYILKNLVEWGANNQQPYSIRNISGILETTSASRITGLESERSPVLAFKIPRAGNTTGFNQGFVSTGIFGSGLSLGWGLTGTRPNLGLNGWLVSGFSSAANFNRDAIIQANIDGKYWQFGIGFTGSITPTNPLTGFKINSISGLSMITNIATAQTTFGPRYWGLLYSSGDINFPAFQTPVEPGWQNYHIVADYLHPTNTANQTINLSAQWNSIIANSGFSLGIGQTGFFRIVGVGGTNLLTPTGFAILASGTTAPNGNNNLSTSGIGVGGIYSMTPYQTPIITTSGAADTTIVSTNFNRSFVGGWNGVSGSTGPHNNFDNQSMFVQGTGNILGEKYVSILFAEVEGFAKFGTYIGNGSTDGPLLVTNFLPKLILIKDISTWPGSVANPSNLQSTHWTLIDNYYNKSISTNTSYYLLNRTGEVLRTDESNNVDFFSNGFKIKSAHGASNTNCTINTLGSRYIFAAFSETPFKYTNAFTGMIN